MSRSHRVTKMCVYTETTNEWHERNMKSPANRKSALGCLPGSPTRGHRVVLQGRQATRIPQTAMRRRLLLLVRHLQHPTVRLVHQVSANRRRRTGPASVVVHHVQVARLNQRGLSVVHSYAMLAWAHVASGHRDDRTGTTQSDRLATRLGRRRGRSTGGGGVGKVQVFAAILNRLLKQILTSRRTAAATAGQVHRRQGHGDDQTGRSITARA